MSGETTTITPVSVAERSQSQQNGELTAPENLVTRMMGRGRAVLNHMNGFPMTTLEKPVRTAEEQQEIDDLEEAFNQPSYTPDHERQTGRLDRLRSKLGMLAARANLKLYELQTGTSSEGVSKVGRLFEKNEARRQRHQVEEGDAVHTRARKFVVRNLAELAVGGVMAGAFAGKAYFATKGIHWNEHLKQPRTVTMGVDMAANAIEYTPVTTDFSEYANHAIVIGGRGDTASLYLYNTLDAQNVIDGSGDKPVNYPASIAPVDSVRMDVSTGIASQNAQNFYNPNDPTQQTIYGFSEGTAGAIDAYNQIVSNNGGVKPDNLSLVIIGSPYAQGGFFNSDYVGIARPVLDSMGIPTDKVVPAGATVMYSPNDFWANGDNQSFLGMLSQLADIGVGHKVPDMNSDQFYSFVDSDGVNHMVLKDQVHPLVELAEANGIYMPPGASNILQQFAPVNNGLSNEVPQPNARAGVRAIADQIGQDVGNPEGAAMVGDTVNRYYGDAIQASTVAVNNIPNQIAAGDWQGASDNFNNALNTAAEAAKPENVVNLTRDTIVNGTNQAVRDLVAPEQQQAAQFAADIWTGFVNKVADDFNAGLANNQAPAPQPTSQDWQPWIDAGMNLVNGLLKPPQQ